MSTAPSNSNVAEATPDLPSPPVASRLPHVEVVHGQRRVDDYFWLRDKDRAEVVAYLEAENRYTDAVTRHLGPLQERLYGEMLGRIKETGLSVPFRDGVSFYYSRAEQG